MEISVFMGQLGYALPFMLGGVGSALGILNAGRAAAGEWAKEGKSGQVQRFVYLTLAGMPLSQTLYGFLFMYMCFAGLVQNADTQAASLLENYGVAIFGIGLACGVLQLASAWAQGLLGAAGCRTLGDSNGKGFVLIVSAMGIAETVGLFGFVFFMLLMPKLA